MPSRRQLAADLADAIAEAGEMASKAIWAELEPLIRQAWGRAVRPRTVALAASADDTALRTIAANWTPPPEVGRLITDLHQEGALTAVAGFRPTKGAGSRTPLPDVFGPVYDQAAQNHLAQATNRLAGIGDSAWVNARAQLTEFMGGPQTREDAKRALEKTLSVSEFRADTIARTETGMAANAGVQYSADTLAAAGFTVIKQWFAQRDTRCRATHVRADGQETPVDGFFTVGGYELAHPLDPSGPAEEVINCRCTMLLVSKPGAPPEPEPEVEPIPEAGWRPLAESGTYRTDQSSDAGRALLDRYGGDPDRGLKTVDFTGFDPDIAWGIATRYDELARDYPTVAARIRSLGRQSKGWASASQGQGFIQFGPSMQRDFDAIRSMNQRMANAHWWASADDMQVVSHEFGHHVGYQAERIAQGMTLSDWATAPASTVEHFLETTRMTHGGELFQRFRRALGISPKATAPRLTPKESLAIKQGISEYATTNWREVTAEAFADVSTHGAGAQEMSKTIVGVMDDLFREAERKLST